MSLFDLGLTLGAGLIVFELLTRFFLGRRVLREVVRLFVLAELAAMRFVRFVYPPRYLLTGKCSMRGTCCTMIVGNPPRFVKDSRPLLGIFAAYHRLFHNFEVVNRGDDDELIFSCGHLQNDGRCGIYRYRPFLCRNYPVQYFYEPPKPLPGCCFGAVARSVTRMRARPSLRILNPRVSVHHPTRDGGRHREELPADFHFVDLS